MTSTPMINQQRFFSTVLPRLFRGTIREILTELLQNAQRAAATRIEFTFPTETTCTITDDGHGLFEGIEDLRRLLVLAESHYLNEQIEENQAPMGMGLYSLITNEAVSQLTIASNGLQLSIDTRRWLHDVAYLESWEERVSDTHAPSQVSASGSALTPLDAIAIDQLEQCSTIGALAPAFHTGFHLRITASADFILDLRGALTSGNPHYDAWNPEKFRERYNPVTGFQDLLDIFLDGTRLRIESSLDEVSIPHAEIIAHYQGNEVRITLPERDAAGLVVNWYGQLIFDWNIRIRYQVYLLVRTGQPVTPQAPTRLQLVQNEHLAALYAWAEDQLFAWASTWGRGQEDLPPPALVERLYQVNAQRAFAECPLAVVQQYNPLPVDYQFDSDNAYRVVDEEAGDASDYLSCKQTVRRQDLDQLLFLQQEVLCALSSNHPAQSYWGVKEKLRTGELQSGVLLPRFFEIGLTSFLRAAGLVAYRTVVGIPEERIGTFWWRPGEPVDRYHTTTLGTWGIQQFPTPKEVDGFNDYAACVPLVTWKPLTEGGVFVADGTVRDNMEAVNWIFGVSSTEQMPALLEKYAYAAFEYDEEDGEESDEENYTDSVKRVIRTYHPDLIDAETLVKSLPRAVNDLLTGQLGDQHTVREATWRFEYRQHERLDLLVDALVLSWPDGHEVRLVLDY